MTNHKKDVSNFPKIIVIVNVVAWILMFKLYRSIIPSRFVNPIDYVMLACVPLTIINMISLIATITKLNKQRGIIQFTLLCIPILVILINIIN